MLKSSLSKKIERILNTTISDSEENSIDDLREMSDKKILDLKNLTDHDEYLAWLYLNYLATDINSDHIWSFVFDVVIGNEDHKNWHKNVVIVGGYTDEDIVKLTSIESIIHPLKEFSYGIGYSQIEFTMNMFNERLQYTGAPCIHLTEYDYRTKLTAPLIAISLNEISADEKVNIHIIDNVKLIALRWLTSYIARRIWTYLIDKDKIPVNLFELYKEKLPGELELNSAVNSAIRVLEKEMELIGGVYSDSIAPGFTIDDNYISKELK